MMDKLAHEYRSADRAGRTVRCCVPADEQTSAEIIPSRWVSHAVDPALGLGRASVVSLGASLGFGADIVENQLRTCVFRVGR